MATVKFQSNLTYKRDPMVSCEKVSKKESETVPESSMSIQEILRKQAAGLVQFDSRPVFLDTHLDQIDKFNGRSLDIDDFEKLNTMIDDMSEDVHLKYEEFKKRQKEEAKAKASEERAKPKPEPKTDDEK